MQLRKKHVTKGDWRTLETFWNVTTTAFFKSPPGAIIKIRYGGGWIFAADRQKQTLDGHDYKKLSVSRWSVLVSRIQILTGVDTDVVYDVEPSSVAVDAPPVHF